MIICLLVFYPASRLDWLVLGRLAAGTLPTIPGNPPTVMLAGTSHTVILIHNAFVYALAPLVLLAAAAGLVALCLSGRFDLHDLGAPPPGSAGTARPGPAAATGRVGAADRA
jgi:hypothetical protein